MDNGIKKKKRGSNLAVQGAILATAGIIVKLIGVAYRIPLINIIGEEGIGCYSKAFVIYAFALMISSYGLPTAVSKIVSARIAEKKYKEAHKVFLTALSIACIVGIISAGIMFFFSKGLANLIYSEKSEYAIKALAPTLFIFSIMAVFRGYFQGMSTMIPTAISQIVEQIFNAIFSIVMASILIVKGYEYGAAGGTLGTGIGALAGLIALIGIYLMSHKLIKKRVRKDTHYNNITSLSLGKVIILTSVPIIIGSAVFHFTNFVDMVMFSDAMRFHGYSEAVSDAMYGMLDGKYKTIVTLPISMASALAAASIPSITTSIVQNDRKQIKRKINIAIRFTMLIAIPSGVGIFVLSRPIILMLFGNDNIQLISNMLKVGSLSVIFFALSTISIGILQGMDKLRIPVVSAAKSLFIKVLFNIILLYVFNTNLYGAVITNIIFAFASSYFNLRAIKKYARIKFDIRKTYIIPLLSSIIMGGVCYLAYYMFNLITKSNIIATVISIIVAVIVYIIILIQLKGIDEEELLSMPKGNKMVKILTKFKLL